ncbi:MAG: DUF721 domain-containing protein [Paludibacteraceae bacterium]|jgi:hypothetical protein|nr:DUF721 domain-containing protein [Paludibacteraceae bacterium]MDD6356823.1 DUF721 domain-containing protein [Bacteroidales bacterium]
MRRKETLSLGQVLKELLKENNLDAKINETKLLNAVEEVFGAHLSSYITGKNIYNKTLFIHVKSSIVRNEMMMVRQNMINLLNEKVGETVITNIVVK